MASDVPEADRLRGPRPRPPDLLAALAVLHQLGAHPVSSVVDTFVISVSWAWREKCIMYSVHIPYE